MSKCLLDREILAADDVLLVPQFGVLEHRADAVLHPFIYSAPMDKVTGLELAKAMSAENEHPVVCRYLESEIDQLLKTHTADNNIFWAVSGDLEQMDRFLKRAEFHGTRVNVCVDIAHGHSVVGRRAVQHLNQIKRSDNLVRGIMCGSICTSQAAADVTSWGATHLRIGCGSGSVCSTRNQTGIGFPQLSAVYNIHNTELYFYKYGQELNSEFGMSPKIIADGGIRNPGDAVKYLAAGADAVMLGRELSRTSESAGWENEFVMSTTSGKQMQVGRRKKYRGQASFQFQREHFGQGNRCPEGEEVSSYDYPSGTVKDVLEKYRGGVASALSYLGLTSLKELKPHNVEFIKITNAARIEGTPHGVQ